MRQIASLLGDKHAQDRANWMRNNTDEVYNYFHSNCAAPDLKVTKEAPESVGNIVYINSVTSD